MKTRNFLLLALSLFLLGLPAFAQGNGTLYGSTGAVGASLVELDPDTGAGTPIGPLGDFGPVSEIVFGPDGTLYGSTGFQGPGPSFIEIDPATGDETFIGDTGDPITGMEFINGTLYGAQINPQGPEGTDVDLVTIDLETGNTTLVASIDAFAIRGLAYDPDTGILYGVGVAPNEADTLFIIDPMTGQATIVGPTDELGGIRFGPDDGLLYGAETRAVDLVGGTVDLLTIDTGSGATSVIGSTGQPAMSGLAFAPSMPPVVSIPTASEVGLAVIAGLLLLAGLATLRRRAGQAL